MTAYALITGTLRKRTRFAPAATAITSPWQPFALSRRTGPVIGTGNPTSLVWSEYLETHAIQADGSGADDRYQIPLAAHLDPKDAETGFLAVKGDPFYRPVQAFLGRLGIEGGAHGQWMMVCMALCYSNMTQRRH